MRVAESMRVTALHLTVVLIFSACGSGRISEATTSKTPNGTTCARILEIAGSCARRLDDTVWCWGKSGLFVDGTYPTHPTQIAIGANVNALTSGSSETCALASGHLWCWGATFSAAQATQVPPFSDVLEVRTSSGRTCVRRTDGTVWCWGSSPNPLGLLEKPTHFPSLDGAIQLAVRIEQRVS